MSLVEDTRLSKTMEQLEREFDSRAGEKWLEGALERREALARAENAVRSDPQARRLASRRMNMEFGGLLVTMLVLPVIMSMGAIALGVVDKGQGISVFIGALAALSTLFICCLGGMPDRAVLQVAGSLDCEDSGGSFDEVSFELNVPGQAEEKELQERRPFMSMDVEFLLFAHSRQLSKRRVAYLAVTLVASSMIAGSMVLMASGEPGVSDMVLLSVLLLFGGCAVLSVELSGWLMFKNDFYGFGKYTPLLKAMPDFGVTGMEMELSRRGVDWRRMS